MSTEAVNGTVGSLLTVRQAAQLLNVHVSTLRRWERVGLVDPARVGPRGDRRYTRTEIEALLVRNGGQASLQMSRPGEDA